MISKTSALMIKKDDVGQLLLEWSSVPQWVKAHVSTKCPPHRYEGDLSIEGQCLVFRGRDIKEGRDFEEVIPFDRIIEVFLAFDERLHGSIDLSFGIGGPAPFIVRYQSEDGEQTAYFNARLSNYPVHVANRNREWYETLEDIVTHPSRWGLKPRRHAEPVLCSA